jgi:hypothetical protein
VESSSRSRTSATQRTHHSALIASVVCRSTDRQLCHQRACKMQFCDPIRNLCASYTLRSLIQSNQVRVGLLTKNNCDGNARAPFNDENAGGTKESLRQVRRPCSSAAVIEGDSVAAHLRCTSSAEGLITGMSLCAQCARRVAHEVPISTVS